VAKLRADGPVRRDRPFGLQPGQWIDDTSRALCLAESLIEFGGSDPGDQMERYVQWWTEGHLSSNGRCLSWAHGPALVWPSASLWHGGS